MNSHNDFTAEEAIRPLHLSCPGCRVGELYLTRAWMSGQLAVACDNAFCIWIEIDSVEVARWLVEAGLGQEEEA